MTDAGRLTPRRPAIMMATSHGLDRPFGKVPPRMPDFEVSSARSGDRMVVALAGDFDLRSRDELRAALFSAVEVAPQVLVDLTAVRFLDSSGLHALVSAHQTAQERGRALYAANATGSVATILRITGIIDLLRPPGEGDWRDSGTDGRPDDERTDDTGNHD